MIKSHSLKIKNNGNIIEILSMHILNSIIGISQYEGDLWLLPIYFGGKN